MHSSCIVVRLDWAAGLPAWLIRRFGSPDLTRKTLFSGQKHQSHSSWDLNEDSWLTPSMNVYQCLDIVRCSTRATDTVGRVTCQSFSHFFSSTTEQQAGWCLWCSSHAGIIVIIIICCRNCFSFIYSWIKYLGNPNFLYSSQCDQLLMALLCEPLSHALASYTSIYICYTGLILYQCEALPVFFSKVTNIHQDVNQVPHAPAWVQPCVSSFKVLHLLVVVYGLSI